MSLKHGHRRGGKSTPIYKLWQNTKQRSSNPNHPRFKDWGGRGVTLYAPWRDSFTGFAMYIINAVGERPSAAHSLDRIDNTLGYVPGNLKWSTAKEQAANRRQGTMPQTRWVRFNGQEYSMNGFARLLGRAYGAVSYRLDHGETPEQVAAHYGYSNVVTVPVAA